MGRLMVNGYEVEEARFPPPIKMLETEEEYEKLSADQVNTRYAAVLEHQLARATYFSKKVTLPQQYLSTQLLNFAESSGSRLGVDSHTTKQSEIELARNIARFEPLVATAMDRLVSFSVTPSTFEGISDIELEAVLNYWRDNLGQLNALDGYVKQSKGLEVFQEKLVRRLLIDGDVVVSETWENVPVPIVTKTAKGRRSVKIKSFNLPTRLSIHNLTSLKVNEVSSLYNREVITIKLPDDIKQLLGKKGNLTPEEKATIEQLPKHFLQQIQDGSEDVSLTDPTSKDSFVSHIKYQGDDYSPYGTSFLNSCFEPVARKYRLRQLDEATITGLINRLTIIKAGVISVEAGKSTITPNRLRQLEQLISQPKVNELIIWPGDDIDVVDIGPTGKILEVENRYAHVDNDILAALGIPRVLLDGKSEMSAQGAIYASFLGVKELIEQDIRNRRVVPFVESLIQKIADVNAYKGEIPRYQMGRVNLADPEVLLNKSKFQYDRGLQSERTAITDSGGKWELESDRRLYESVNGIVTNFGLPDLAFNAPEDRGNSGPKPKTEKVSKPDKPDSPSSNSSRAFLEDYSYEYEIEKLYKDHTSRIVRTIENDGDISETKIKAALIVLFGLLKRETGTYLANKYEDLTEESFRNKDILDEVVSWSNAQFENWYDSVVSEISRVINTVDDKSLLLPLISGVFALSLSNRLYKYRVAIPSKVERASQVSASISNGMTYATWVATLDERTCEYCAEMHGKTMPINEALGLYPAHPNCRCDYIEHTDLPKDADLDLPVKDSGDWSSVRR